MKNYKPKVGDNVMIALQDEVLYWDIDTQGDTLIVRVWKRVFNLKSKAIKKISKL
jgi:hypothetical protein